LGHGAGPGLTPNYLGSKNGAEQELISLNQMPSHHHTAQFTSTSASANGGTASGTSNVTITPIALNDEGDQNSPTGNVPAKFTPSGGSAYGEYDAGSPSDYTDMHPLTSSFNESLTVSLSSVNTNGTVALGNTGTNYPVNIAQPSLALNYIICIDGIFPSRN
jgi:microcystin-dependent protein